MKLHPLRNPLAIAAACTLALASCVNVDPNTKLIISPNHNRFLNIQKEPGGNLGGDVETFSSNGDLQITGTGLLQGFSRNITAPPRSGSDVGVARG